MVAYDECAAAINWVFDAHEPLMLICLVVGVFLGWIAGRCSGKSPD